jgi:phosphoglycolate phosphatase-like HAD superfamily hydrolase
VGDSWKDIEAGRTAACTTVLIKSAGQHYAGPKPDFLANDLGNAVEIILSGACPRR